MRSAATSYCGQRDEWKLQVERLEQRLEAAEAAERRRKRRRSGGAAGGAKKKRR